MLWRRGVSALCFLALCTQSQAQTTCPAGAVPEAGLCVLCPAGTLKATDGAGGCVRCPVGFSTTQIGASVCVPCGVITSNRPKAVANALDWDGAKFTSLCGGQTCVGPAGRVSAGSVTTGSQAIGHAAAVSMPFIQGTTATRLLWDNDASSIKSIAVVYTVCSIARYTNSADLQKQQRILTGDTWAWVSGRQERSAWVFLGILVLPLKGLRQLAVIHIGL